jgi:hypothetical protein
MKVLGSEADATTPGSKMGLLLTAIYGVRLWTAAGQVMHPQLNGAGEDGHV